MEGKRKGDGGKGRRRGRRERGSSYLFRKGTGKERGRGEGDGGRERTRERRGERSTSLVRRRGWEWVELVSWRGRVPR